MRLARRACTPQPRTAPRVPRTRARRGHFWLALRTKRKRVRPNVSKAGGLSLHQMAAASRVLTVKPERSPLPSTNRGATVRYAKRENLARRRKRPRLLQHASHAHKACLQIRRVNQFAPHTGWPRAVRAKGTLRVRRPPIMPLVTNASQVVIREAESPSASRVRQDRFPMLQQNRATRARQVDRSKRVPAPAQAPAVRVAAPVQAVPPAQALPPAQTRPARSDREQTAASCLHRARVLTKGRGRQMRRRIRRWQMRRRRGR